jgi:hypothetical protein
MGVKELSGDKKVQRSLFDHNQTDKMKALEKTRDKIKDSFGDGALTSGASLEHSVRFQKRPRVKPDS